MFGNLILSLKMGVATKVAIALALSVQYSFSLWSVTGLPKTPPRIWVHSDIHPPNTGGDQDDLVAMAMLLQLSNLMDLRGVVVGIDTDGSASACPTTKDWLLKNHWADYKKEVANMNKHYGGYKEDIPLYQTAFCHKDFDESKPPKNINDPQFESMKKFIEEAEKGELFVSIWGELVEMAEIIHYLKAQNTPAAKTALSNIRVIPHWVIPKNAANCTGSPKACDYIYKVGATSEVAFYNIGDIGEKGIVQNSCNENHFLNVDIVKASNVGAHIKWKSIQYAKTPDMSDAASFLVPLGAGGGMANFKSDGSHSDSKRNDICKDRPQIFKYWERGALAAQGQGTYAPPYGASTSIDSDAAKLSSDRHVTFAAGTLQFKGDFGTNASVEIFNTRGQSLYASQTLESIPLNLKEGLYFVHIRDDKSIQSNKIVVTGN